jgi:hypothetical protein
MECGQLLEVFSLLDLLVVVVSPPGAPLLEVVVEDSEVFSDAAGAAGADGAPSAPVAPEAPVAPDAPVAPVAPDSPGGPLLQPAAPTPTRNARPIKDAKTPVFFFATTISSFESFGFLDSDRSLSTASVIYGVRGSRCHRALLSGEHGCSKGAAGQLV